MVGGDCNIRHPSGWRVLASNDGENWDVLDEQSGVMYTSAYQQKRFDMNNTLAYNQYRLYATEFNQQPFSSDGSMCSWFPGVQLADFYLFTKRLPAVCPAQDGFPASTSGQTASKPCEDGYTGTISRVCDNEGEWGEEVRNCRAAAPKSIKYDVQSVELTAKKAMEPLTPVIDGMDTTVTVFPMLPEGLSIDSTTGVISGTPKEEMEQKRYTINAKNEEGAVYTTLNITVNKAPFNWLLLVIIIVVVSL